MAGGKLYHILHVDTNLLATCEILTVGLLRIKIFWNIMSHQLVTIISISRDCSTFIFRVKQTLRKVGSYLPGNMAKQPWYLQSEEFLATFIKSVLEYFISTGSCKNSTLSLNLYIFLQEIKRTDFVLTFSLLPGCKLE